MLSRHPQPRLYPTAVGVGRKLYIWGGKGDSIKIPTTSIESFNVSSLTWEQTKQFHGSLPDCLWDVAVTSEGEVAYSFGGMNVDSRFNTLYEFNFSTQRCRELVPENPSNAPMKKSGSGMVFFNQKLVVHGGSPGRNRGTDDLHVFDLTMSKEMRREGDMNGPLRTVDKRGLTSYKGSGKDYISCYQ